MSDGSKDFFMVLNAVKIMDNHDLFKGEVRLISVACTNLVPNGEESLLKVETPLFKNVKRGSFLSLGTAGKLLYASAHRPKFLNWSLWVIEDDSDVRDTGKLIADALASDEFKGIETSLKSLLASNPVAQVAQTFVTQAAKLLAGIVMKNKDDQIGVIDTTFIHKLHNIDNFSVSGDACGDSRLAYTLRYV